MNKNDWEKKKFMPLLEIKNDPCEMMTGYQSIRIQLQRVKCIKHSGGKNKLARQCAMYIKES